MSTRCHIGFYGKEPTQKEIDKPDVLLYKHSDGYPEGTLPQLTEFCMLFNEHRGLSDTEYAGARAMQYLTNYADKETNEFYDQRPDITQETRDTFSFLGYGISKNFHGDIEYHYAVSPESIKVYTVHYKENENGDWKPTFAEIEKEKVALKD